MIFTILKVIGIILLVVLALILTALLCVLFVPVKYRAVGSFDNTDIRAKAHVSWLLHLFALHIEYAQETDGYIRLAFVKKKLFDNYEAFNDDVMDDAAKTETEDKVSENTGDGSKIPADESEHITDEQAEDISVKKGSIEFDHVWFKYKKEAKEYVLSDVSFNIEAGQTIGIIGQTGSAKTTLVSLIPRLYDATKGTVRIDGIDVKKYPMRHLRDAIAVVLQKNTLFSGSLLSNLYWGNENASMEEINEACHIACVDEFLDRLPQGYDTDMGQGGVNVSGGQKQRICIVVGVTDFEKIMSYNEQLQKEGIFYRGSDVEDQILYVMGDMEKNIRTHHIHIVKWNGTEWKNYIHFRDYLNDNENMALQYQKVKEELESKYADDRVAYTNGKQEMIDIILNGK